jgi:hypothetical protein
MLDFADVLVAFVADFAAVVSQRDETDQGSAQSSEAPTASTSTAGV